MDSRIIDNHKIIRPQFRQEIGELKLRDIQIDNYYDYTKRTILETFFSPCNAPQTQDTRIE